MRWKKLIDKNVYPAQLLQPMSIEYPEIKKT